MSNSARTSDIVSSTNDVFLFKTQQEAIDGCECFQMSRVTLGLLLCYLEFQKMYLDYVHEHRHAKDSCNTKEFKGSEREDSYFRKYRRFIHRLQETATIMKDDRFAEACERKRQVHREHKEHEMCAVNYNDFESFFKDTGMSISNENGRMFTDKVLPIKILETVSSHPTFVSKKEYNDMFSSYFLNDDKSSSY